MGYRRRYKRYRRDNTDVLSEFLYLLIVGIIKLGKLAFNFGSWLYDNKSNLKNAFKLNTSYRPSSSPSITYAQEEHFVPEPEEESIFIPNVQTKNPASERYTLRPTLLTPAEQNFLDVLTKVVDGRYIIENQVQLSRIVTPIDSNRNYVNYGDFNRIKAKSIDFVLYDNSYRPILCIELDDRSHLRWDRVKRDLLVNEVMNGVGLPILHVPASYSYNLIELKDNILRALANEAMD